MKKFIFPILSFIVAFVLAMAVCFLVSQTRGSDAQNDSYGGGTGYAYQDSSVDHDAKNSVKRFETDSAEVDAMVDTLDLVGEQPSEPAPAVDSLSMPVFAAGYPANAILVSVEEYHYRIVIKASAANGDPLEYQLETPSNAILKSSTGIFNDLVPGKYVCRAVNLNNPSLYAEKEMTCPVRKPINSITTQELSAIYNSGDYASNKPKLDGKFVKDFRITYDGMDTSSEINALPKTHAELCQKIRMGVWTSIAVTEVKCDALGYVVAINVNYVKAD